MTNHEKTKLQNLILSSDQNNVTLALQLLEGFGGYNKAQRLSFIASTLNLQKALTATTHREFGKQMRIHYFGKKRNLAQIDAIIDAIDPVAYDEKTNTFYHIFQE